MKDMHGDELSVGDRVSVVGRLGFPPFKGVVRVIKPVSWAKGPHARVDDSPTDDPLDAENSAWVSSGEVAILVGAAVA